MASASGPYGTHFQKTPCRYDPGCWTVEGLKKHEATPLGIQHFQRYSHRVVPCPSHEKHGFCTQDKNYKLYREGRYQYPKDPYEKLNDTAHALLFSHFKKTEKTADISYSKKSSVRDSLPRPIIDSLATALHGRIKNIFQSNVFWIDFNPRLEKYQITFQTKGRDTVNSQLNTIASTYSGIHSDLLNLQKMPRWQCKKANKPDWKGDYLEVTLKKDVLEEIIRKNIQEKLTQEDLDSIITTLAAKTLEDKVQRFEEQFKSLLSTIERRGAENLVWRIDINMRGNPHLKILANNKNDITCIKKGIERFCPDARALRNRDDYIVKVDESKEVRTRHGWEGDCSLSVFSTPTFALLNDPFGRANSHKALRCIRDKQVKLLTDNAQSILAGLVANFFGAEYQILVNLNNEYAVEFIVYSTDDREKLERTIEFTTKSTIKVNEEWQKKEEELAVLEGQPNTAYTFILDSSGTMMLLGMKRETGKTFNEVMQKLSGLNKLSKPAHTGFDNAMFQMAGSLPPKLAGNKSPLPMPDSHWIFLEEGVFFSKQEYESLKKDAQRFRWYKTSQENRVNIHRSWTGNMIWSIQFERQKGGGATVQCIEVNDNEKQYLRYGDRTEIAEALSMLKGAWKTDG